MGYKALTESVNDFNSAGAAKTNSMQSIINWKVIKGIEFFNDSKFIDQYGGRLMACRIGENGTQADGSQGLAAQSGYILYHANYDAGKNLVINCVEMLKIPGILKRNYESSMFRVFTNIDQLEVTSDAVYHKHAATILNDLVKYLDNYKSNPDFAGYFQEKQAQEEKSRKQEDLQTKEASQKVETVKVVNRAAFQTAKSQISTLQEGDVLCLTTQSDLNHESASDIIAYVEKYNSSKTKLQIRIHSVSQYDILNKYDNIAFVKGDIIWINLPMADERKYWIKCK